MRQILLTVMLAAALAGCEDHSRSEKQADELRQTKAQVEALKSQLTVANSNRFEESWRLRKNHEAQQLSIKINEMNRRIESERQSRARCSRAVFDAIETSKKLPRDRASALLESAHPITADIRNAEDRLTALSISNKMLWIEFRAAFDAAGSAFVGQLPEAYRCDPHTEFRLSSW